MEHVHSASLHGTGSHATFPGPGLLSAHTRLNARFHCILVTVYTGMAKNLLEDCKARDKQLMVFNRTTAKSEPLRKAGAHV